ncbi:hypothetical protein ACFL34_05330, partial [Candidatus Sumerlaeota bacterium]
MDQEQTSQTTKAHRRISSVELLKWGAVIAVFLIVLHSANRSKNSASFWLSVWRSLLNDPDIENVELVADRIGQHCRTEEALDFYYNKYFLEHHIAHEFGIEGVVQFNQRKLDFLVELPDCSREFQDLCRFEADVLIEGQQARKDWSLDEITAISDVANLGLSVRAMEHVAFISCRPWDQTLPIRQFVQLLELEIFLHDLERELLYLRDTADVRLVLASLPGPDQGATPWPAPVYEDYYMLTRDRYQYVVSENLAPQIYTASFRDHLTSVLEGLAAPTPRPLALAIAIQGQDNTFRSWVFHGFVYQGNWHVVKAKPVPKHYAALLAVGAGPAAEGPATSGLLGLSAAEQERFEEIVRQLQYARSNQKPRKTMPAMIDADLAGLLDGASSDSLRQLLAFSVKHLEPRLELEEGQAHLAFNRYIRAKLDRDEFVRTELQALNLPTTMDDKAKSSLTPRQLLKVMNGLTDELES